MQHAGVWSSDILCSCAVTGGWLSPSSWLRELPVVGIAPTDTLPQPIAAYGKEPERDLIALASSHAPCHSYQVGPAS